MLYYYDIIGIVIWANTVKDILYDKYKKFIINEIDKPSSKQNNNIIEILESSINKSGCNWCPEEIQKEYMQGSYYLGGGKTGMARRLSFDEPSLTLEEILQLVFSYFALL